MKTFYEVESDESHEYRRGYVQAINDLINSVRVRQSDKLLEKWTCDECAQQFDEEVDLLAHQFNSSCDPNRQ